MMCHVTVRLIAHPNPEEAIRVVATAFLREWEREQKREEHRAQSSHLLSSHSEYPAAQVAHKPW